MIPIQSTYSCINAQVKRLMTDKYELQIRREGGGGGDVNMG